MIFTREDILKIQNALLQLGRKDSEFKDANTPLNSNDEIAILQDGINKKVSINNLLSTLGLLKKDDFINISDRYDEYYILLSEAITIIANNKRKKGLVITFLDLQGDWKIFQFDGELNNFSNTDYWKDLFDFKYPIVNSVLPDEEDLTLTLPNEDNNSFIKLKDKEYDTTNFSGMGTKIIRKNIIEITLEGGSTKRINYLSPDVFNSENTIYEIRYEFDLNGQTINIPNNCVLRFNGGVLSNGTLKGNNTYIKADIIQIFQLNLIIDGTWKVNISYPEWFGAKGDGKTDDTQAIQKLIDAGFKIHLIKFYGVTSLKMIDVPIRVIGTSVEESGLVGIENNLSILYFSGVSRGSTIKDIYILGKSDGINQVGIYAEAVPVYWGTAGLWHTVINTIDIRDVDIAIKFKAIDNPNDVANLFFLFSNMNFRAIRYRDFDIQGQVGQSSINDCYFDWEPKNTRDARIYFDSTGGSSSDGLYLNFNNCSWEGTNPETILKATGPIGGFVQFFKCWFENMKGPFILSKTNMNIQFNSCFFLNCKGDYFVKDCGAHNLIEIIKCVGFESSFVNLLDETSINGSAITIYNDSLNIENYTRMDTRINPLVLKISVAASSTKTPIILNYYVPNGYDINMVLTKHASYSFNITGIFDQNNNLLGYFRMSNQLHLKYVEGKWFIVCKDSTLYGTSEERTNVINTALISAGFLYFDTTLNKLVIWNGTNWVDVAGQTV